MKPSLDPAPQLLPHQATRRSHHPAWLWRWRRRRSILVLLARFPARRVPPDNDVPPTTPWATRRSGIPNEAKSASKLATS